MTKRKKSPKIKKEVLEIAPFAARDCDICQLPIDQIKEVHRLRFEEKWIYAKLVEYLKKTYKMSKNKSTLSNHFRKHVGVNALTVKRKNISDILLTDQDPNSKIKDQILKTSYMKLAGMSATFTERLEKIVKKVNKRFKDEEKLEKEIDAMGIFDLMEKVAGLDARARSQIKDINALNQPKVIVAQFLQSSLNKIVADMSDIFNSLCSMVQNSVLKELKDKGIEVDKVLDSQTFISVFQPIAIQYKENMKSIVREQMASAMATLSEMEKIV